MSDGVDREIMPDVERRACFLYVARMMETEEWVKEWMKKWR